MKSCEMWNKSELILGCAEKKKMLNSDAIAMSSERLMHYSFVTTAPPHPPPTGNSGDNEFSSIKALLKALHCGDLLRVIAPRFIIVNSKRAYFRIIIPHMNFPCKTSIGRRVKILTITPGGISDTNLVQVCRLASSYPPYKCILEYGKGIPINVYTIMEDNNKCSTFPLSWGIFMKKSINLVK